MVAVQNFVACEGDKWIQVCEYRESRTALSLTILNGAAVFGFVTSGPIVHSTQGYIPAGVWCSIDYGTGPGIFRLSRALDGDLVKQAWFAYCPSDSNPFPPFPTVETFALSQFWTCPGFVHTVTAKAKGGGGAGADCVGGVGNTGGGAGGAAFAVSNIVNVIPGTNYLVAVANVVDRLHPDGYPSYFTNTGLPPTNPSEGALGVGGFGAAVDGTGFGGMGGQAIDCIGDDAWSGGHGGNGDANPNNGGGGGQDASFGSDGNSGQSGGAGGIGGSPGNNNGGPNSPAGDPSALQVPDGGGGGGSGSNDNLDGGAGQPGSQGAVILEYTVAPPWSPIVVVLESFNVPPLNKTTKQNEDDAKAQATFTFNLPRLSYEGMVALQDLMAKIQYAKGLNDEMPNPPEHDNADSGHDAN